MKNDRFLIVIISFVGFFVVLAVVLYFLRQEPQDYGPEDSPQGVVRNYVLALQGGDYQHAYAYLQESENKPDFSTFQQIILQNETSAATVAVQLGKTHITGDRARVSLILLHFNADPLSRSWDESSAALLILQDGNWRITSMPYPYWGWDWYSSPK